MADIHSIYRTGIYDALIPTADAEGSIVDNAFSAAVKADDGAYKLFYAFAPSAIGINDVTVIAPYVVFDILPITNSQDTASDFYDAMVQFVITAKTLAECERLAELLKTILKDKQSSVQFPGCYTLSISERLTNPMGFEDGFWNFSVQFSIKLQR